MSTAAEKQHAAAEEAKKEHAAHHDYTARALTRRFARMHCQGRCARRAAPRACAGA
jgi:hypothetical protein